MGFKFPERDRPAKGPAIFGRLYFWRPGHFFSRLKENGQNISPSGQLQNYMKYKRNQWDKMSM
jgi:hypothetical protein